MTINEKHQKIMKESEDLALLMSQLQLGQVEMTFEYYPITEGDNFIGS